MWSPGKNFEKTDVIYIASTDEYSGHKMRMQRMQSVVGKHKMKASGNLVFSYRAKVNL